MMNNPSFPHHGYGQSVDGSGMAPFPSDLSQQFQQPQFSQAGISTPNRPQQFQGQIPPQLQQQYQQYQQQQQHQLLQQQHQHLQQQQAQAGGQFARPQSRDNFGLTGKVESLANEHILTQTGQGARSSPTGQHNRSQSVLSQGNAPNTPQRQTSASMQAMNNMNMGMGMNMNMMQQSPGGPQMAQNMNMQAVRAPVQQVQAPPSPQTAAREEERVATLLEINAHLILEVSNLQAQGKGPSSQQTPTSPTANDPTPNSPADRKPPSQEYADCMRRLQANLAYLAAIADSSKKTTAPKPVGPAILIPPNHLTSVHGLYQKLKTLFPEASQTTLNKAMAVANAQAARAAGNPAQSQMQQTG